MEYRQEYLTVKFTLLNSYHNFWCLAMVIKYVETKGVLLLPSKSHSSGTTGPSLTNEVTKCFCFCDLYMNVHCETFGSIKKNPLKCPSPTLELLTLQYTNNAVINQRILTVSDSLDIIY